MAETKSASLTVLGGPLAGTRCVLPESGTVTLGSAPGSGLCVDLPTVSPYHARIVVEDGRVTVHDTGAARALHVNDNPLEADGTVLRNGDILWLGSPGEDDVVMLQCILPRRPSTSQQILKAEPVLVPPLTAAEPTPEIETTALWAVGPDAASPPAPRVAAEPVRAEMTGFEETIAILSRASAAPAEEDLVVEASLPAGEAEEEMLVAAEVVAEPTAFAEEAGPSPTILVASPDEVDPAIAEPDFGSTVAFEPEDGSPVDLAPPGSAELEPISAVVEPAAPPGASGAARAARAPGTAGTPGVRDTAGPCGASRAPPDPSPGQPPAGPPRRASLVTPRSRPAPCPRRRTGPPTRVRRRLRPDRERRSWPRRVSSACS